MSDSWSQAVEVSKTGIRKATQDVGVKRQGGLSLNDAPLEHPPGRALEPRPLSTRTQRGPGGFRPLSSATSRNAACRASGQTPRKKVAVNVMPNSICSLLICLLQSVAGVAFSRCGLAGWFCGALRFVGSQSLRDVRPCNQRRHEHRRGGQAARPSAHPIVQAPTHWRLIKRAQSVERSTPATSPGV